MTWQGVPPGMLQRPIPKPEDILDALGKIKSTVSDEDAERFQGWTERFGSSGS
jgi:Vps4 C terminal oligomerisation domain